MQILKKFLKKNFEKRTLNRLYLTFTNTYDNPVIQFIRKIMNIFRPKYSSLFFFTLPKSASESICYELTDILNFNRKLISAHEYFSNDIFSRHLIRQVNFKGDIVSDHIPLNEFNKKCIEHYKIFNKIIINIRDPRNAIISFAFYCKRQMGHDLLKNEFSKFMRPKLDQRIVDMNDFQLIDYFIKNYYSHFIDWISQWSNYAENKNNILILKYEDYINDPKTYIQNILNFNSYPKVISDEYKFKKKIHVNNKNKLSETDYKIQMTKDQILYVDKIGEMVLKKFYKITYE